MIRERIAATGIKCDHHKCQREWDTQMREKGQILHLCYKHAADLVGARNYDKNGHAADKFVESLFSDSDEQSN